jgi:sulfatase maturation enzyme AslB (radical SAM superfamily)
VAEEDDPQAWFAGLEDLHAKEDHYYRHCQSCEASRICNFGCSAFDKNDREGKQGVCEATRLFFAHLATLPVPDLETLVTAGRQLRLM